MVATTAQWLNKGCLEKNSPVETVNQATTNAPFYRHDNTLLKGWLYRFVFVQYIGDPAHFQTIIHELILNSCKLVVDLPLQPPSLLIRESIVLH